MTPVFLVITFAGLCGLAAHTTKLQTCTPAGQCPDTALLQSHQVKAKSSFTISEDQEGYVKKRKGADAGLNDLKVATITSAELMQAHCPVQIPRTLSMHKSLYSEISVQVKAVLNSLPEVCNEHDCPRADWAGCVLRMAGHDFMDYVQPGEGGSDACTDFGDPDNAGLKECLAEGEFDVSVGNVYANFCLNVSLADMIVVAAEAVIEQTRQWHIDANKNDFSTRYSQSKPVSFADSFKFGRETKGKGECMFRPHLLPNPAHGCDDVKRNFMDFMGMTKEQTAAISGVHTLGRARPGNSGFDGWWSDPLNSRRFNNNYFVSMLTKGWMPEELPSGKKQWRMSNFNRSAVEHEMMLTSDLCLLYNSGMDRVERSPHAPLAHDADCCAWMEAKVQFYGGRNTRGKYNHGMHCGSAPKPLGNPQRTECCDGRDRGDGIQDCGFPLDPRGIAVEAVLSYANDDNLFVDAFKEAWLLATEIGHKNLQTMGGNLVTTTTTTPITADLKEKQLAKVTPSDVMAPHCAKQIPTTVSMTRELYINISSQIKSVLSSLPEECNHKVCPRADWSGCVLRMAGHDFMDFAPGEGGADGCTDFNDPDNAGLKECLAEGEFNVSVGTVYANFCDVVSLADMIVIAAEAVVEQTRQWHVDAWANDSTSQYRKSKPVSFVDTFKFGRSTKATGECQFRPHMLPNPENGCTDVERNFMKFMGLTKRQTTALLGVHTLGRARPGNSGFDGWWSDPLNSRRFNNNYYVSMAFKGWMPQKLPSRKIQWFMSNLNRGNDAHQMMLTSDICLMFGASKYDKDNTHRPPYRPVNSSDSCCAWVESRIRWWHGRDNARHNGGFICGVKVSGQGNVQRQPCCNGKKSTKIDCGFPLDAHGLASMDVIDFAYDDNLFVQEFQNVWVLATEIGHEGLQPLIR